MNETHKEFLNNCKLKITTKIKNNKICFEHFLIKDNIFENEYPFHELSILEDNVLKEKVSILDSDITFIGHEHKLFEVDDNNKRLIDVGSSGCTKDGNTFYTILTIDNNNNINIDKINVKYDRKKFEKHFNNTSYPDKEIIGKIFFGINSLL